MVAFSVISIPALKPFLELLLGQEQIVRQPPTTPLSITNIKSLTEHFYYQLSQIIIQNGKEHALILLCVAIVIIYFFRNLFRYLSLYFISPARNGIVRDLRQQLFNKVTSLPLAYFSEERKGDLLTRISNDVQEIDWSILNVLETVVRAPLMIIGSVLMMVLLSPHLTVFVLVLIAFTAIVIGGIGKLLRKDSTLAQEKLSNLISIIEETIGGLRIVKGFNAERHQHHTFLKENNAYRRAVVRIARKRDLASPLSEFLGVAIVAVLIWYGFREVQQGLLNPSGFIVFLYAFFSVIDPAKTFSSAFYNIQKGIASMERIETILDAPVTIQDVPQAQALATFTDKIEYKKVSFRYKQDTDWVLKNIDLTIPKGKVVALVGMSGAGKSTLIDLLPRFYDVTDGTILIDGADIRQLKLYDLRTQIGIVTQEAILFNDTIYNNIVFGKKDVTEEDVMAAAKVANAHDFILQTEHGYKTNIGDRGMKLSGGQRQRLTIARAILKNPPILILDEATSALDSESEQLVQAALVALMQNRTAIIIAHRLSTIQHADEIVVMKNGSIVERGTHDMLLQKQNGEYAKLVALQTF